MAAVDEKINDAKITLHKDQLPGGHDPDILDDPDMNSVPMMPKLKAFLDS